MVTFRHLAVQTPNVQLSDYSASVLQGNDPNTETALPSCTAIDTLCSKKLVSRGSLVEDDVLLNYGNLYTDILLK